MAADYTISTTGGTGTVWFNWTSVSTTTDTTGAWTTWTSTTIDAVPERFVSRVNDPAVLERLSLARQEQLDRAEKHRLEQQQALERSKELFLSMLSEEQRAEFVGKGWFVVSGKRGRYKIYPQDSYNVFVLDESGLETNSLCCVPKDDVPLYDHLLAQKLYLEHDESYFLRKANTRKVRQ
jgi:hypothetical protein